MVSSCNYKLSRWLYFSLVSELSATSSFAFFINETSSEEFWFNGTSTCSSSSSSSSCLYSSIYSSSFSFLTWLHSFSSCISKSLSVTLDSISISFTSTAAASTGLSFSINSSNPMLFFSWWWWWWWWWSYTTSTSSIGCSPYLITNSFSSCWVCSSVWAIMLCGNCCCCSFGMHKSTESLQSS